MTSKIKFEDVIVEVKKYAFKKSPFPVILSLENHCSLPQQDVMAKILKEKLGEDLIVPDLDDVYLPSPSALERKIIIKGKTIRVNADEDEDDDYEEQKLEMEEVKRKAEKGDEDSGEEEEKETEVDDSKGKDKKGKGKKKEKEEEKKEEAPAKPKPSKKKKQKKTKTAESLSELTFLSGVKFQTFEDSKLNDTNTMSSFSEPKTNKLIEKDRKAWIEYNMTYLSRIYPAGTRCDSSNYDPVPSWCVGSQITALNYQTPCKEMQLNQGLFTDNGRCGYVLKPSFLRVPGREKEMYANPQYLDVTILSGVRLPKPSGSSKGEVIDPYVKIDCYGTVEPDSEKHYHEEHKTATVQDNGFNPMWNETKRFTVNCPALCIVHFTVHDYDKGSADDFIASCAMPFESIRPGIRNVSLADVKGKTKGDFECCSLLVHFEFSDAPKVSLKKGKKKKGGKKKKK